MSYKGRYRATNYPTVRITFWGLADDWQWMRARHPHDASAALRRLIHDYRKQAEDPSEPDFESLDLENL